MIRSISNSGASASFFGVGYIRNSSGVTLFTPTSVVCAERIVAIVSSNAFRCVSAHTTFGYVLRSASRMAFTRSGASGFTVFFRAGAFTALLVLTVFTALLIVATPLPQTIQHLHRLQPHPAEDRIIFQRVEAGFGLAQLLHQVEEVLREVGLKRHHKLLVVQPKRVGSIQLHPRILQPNADVLIHQPLPLRSREQIPRPRLPERIDKDVLLPAWTNRPAPFALTLVLAVDRV